MTTDIVKEQGERMPITKGVATTVAEDARIRGPWLVAARLAWIFLLVTSLWDFAVAIRIYHDQTLHPCVAPSCPITPAQAVTLRDVGVSLSLFANLTVGLAIALTLIGAALALALFLRRSDTVIALAVGVFLYTFPVGNLTTGVSFTLISPLVDNTLSLLSLAIAFSVFMIFPDGRFTPRWTWALVVAWVAFHVALSARPGASWLDAFYPMIYLSAIGVQVYRYLRVSNARQRQQTKIVVIGIAIALLANILFWIALPAVIPGLSAPGSLYPLIGYSVYLMLTLILPISFAVAIQRHQLFDVDVLINRALVYGSLTAILAALYFGVVIGAQRLTGLVTGKQGGQQTIVIVLTTLLISALAQPLRSWLQRGIDRRFYRSRYDASKTITTFSAALRSEVDLNQLTEHLLYVVDDTMHPAQVSLWLTPAHSGATLRQ